MKSEVLSNHLLILIKYLTFPASSKITATTPKKGKHADPGLVGVHPGRGVITCPPVSVYK